MKNALSILSLASQLFAWAIVAPITSSAAELLLNYDVSAPGAWSDGVLRDANENGFPQVALEAPSQEAFDQMAGLDGFDPSIQGPGDFGVPDLVVGQGPGKRSYLHFGKLGALTYLNQAESQEGITVKGGSDLNDGGNSKGYTFEMLVRISPDFKATAMHVGVGCGSTTTFENNMLMLSAGPKVFSMSTVLEQDQESPGEDQNNLSMLTPLPASGIVSGDWVHLVKVHDPQNKKVSFYLDGVEFLEEDIAQVPDGAVYPGGRSEFLFLVGENPRRIQGLDFSFFRAYRGVMSPAEVATLYANVTKTP